jgi:hypothetical protein
MGIEKKIKFYAKMVDNKSFARIMRIQEPFPVIEVFENPPLVNVNSFSEGGIPTSPSINYVKFYRYHVIKSTKSSVWFLYKQY